MHGISHYWRKFYGTSMLERTPCGTVGSVTILCQTRISGAGLFVLGIPLLSSDYFISGVLCCLIAVHRLWSINNLLYGTPVQVHNANRAYMISFAPKASPNLGQQWFGPQDSRLSTHSCFSLLPSIA